MSKFKYTTISRALRVATGAAMVAGLIHGGVAKAATATENLAASASVTNNCTISTTAVAFGAYDPVVTNASAARDAAGTITVTCTMGASVAVTLGQGLNADTGSTDAAPARRLLSGTTDYLSYQLYSESGRTTVWGNTAPTGVAHTGTGAAVALDVYGRITGNQNVPAGTYNDTVVATVTF